MLTYSIRIRTATVQVDVNPRKFPKQQRARMTVEAIIVAAAQLLTKLGYESLTTARVAERAGVSIGSLYQYFPNKQALAAAVVDHYGDEVLATFAAAPVHETLAESVDGMIRFALVSHPHEPELHRAINELAPRIGRQEKTREISDRMAHEIERKLERHHCEIAPDLDLKDSAALIETILETVVHRAIQKHPVSVGADRMVGQCHRLIMAYLTSSLRSDVPSPTALESLP